MSGPFDKGHQLFDEISTGRRTDYEVLYKITASEDYHGTVTHVGFVELEGYHFAVDFTDDEVTGGRFYTKPDSTATFPAKTVWMITNNSSIDYGIEVDTDEIEA